MKGFVRGSIGEVPQGNVGYFVSEPLGKGGPQFGEFGDSAYMELISTLNLK